MENAKRFLMGLVCNERSSRALPQAVPRLSPMGRSTQPNGFPRRGAPVSEPLLGLCTAPVRTNRSHTSLSSFEVITELILSRGSARAPTQ